MAAAMETKSKVRTGVLLDLLNPTAAPTIDLRGLGPVMVVAVTGSDQDYLQWIWPDLNLGLMVNDTIKPEVRISCIRACVIPDAVAPGVAVLVLALEHFEVTGHPDYRGTDWSDKEARDAVWAKIDANLKRAVEIERAMVSFADLVVVTTRNALACTHAWHAVWDLFPDGATGRDGQKPAVMLCLCREGNKVLMDAAGTTEDVLALFGSARAYLPMLSKVDVHAVFAASPLRGARLVKSGDGSETRVPCRDMADQARPFLVERVRAACHAAPRDPNEVAWLLAGSIRAWLNA